MEPLATATHLRVSSPVPPTAPSSSHQPTPSLHGWRGEGTPRASHSTPSFVTELRSKLKRCFADKEPDHFGPIYAALVALAPKCTEPERRSLRELLPHLHPFTSLISDEERQALIAAKALDGTHKGLTSYHLLAKKLGHTLEQATTSAFQQQIQVLQSHYQDQLRVLLSAQDRGAFLKPKAQLWHHGFFLIDRALARRLLSCDEAGKISRSNPYGSRPVIQHHGMHLKIGAEGYPELDPASEAAVSSLCHLLSPKKMTAAPTSVFYIRMPGKCEALVQASLSVGGGDQRLPSAIPLNELLDLLSSFDLLKEHFGSLVSLRDSWEKLMVWAGERPEEMSPPDVLKSYLQWMKTVPSKRRCKEFMEPDDLPECGRPFSFFSRDSWEHQLSHFHDYLRNYSPLVWAKLLKLLKQEPSLMAGRSIRPLLRLYRSLTWISKLFPNARFDQIARELPILLDKIDRDALSRLFLASLIVNPHDGKADNYMVAIDWKEESVTGLTIIGIDNDLAFEPPVLKASKTHHMGTKCLLYALPPALLKSAISKEVREDLCERSLEKLVLRWITQLDRQNQIYAQMVETGLTAQDLSLKLPKEALATAIHKLRRIRSLLEQEGTILEEVFREVEPVVFYAYREACHRTSNGKDALALLGWKSGLPLEALLKTTFARVDLDGRSISLKEAYQQMAKGKVKRTPLSTATQAALDSRQLPLKSSHLKCVAQLSFVDQLKVSLKSPQKLLVRAIQSLNVSLARLALLNGAKPNQFDTAGYPPLPHLIPFPGGDRERGHQMLKSLVEFGIDLEWKDPNSGETLLDFAARQAFAQEFIALISHGAGRDVQPAPALAFALAFIATPGMKEALRVLEARSPRVAWLQDLPAMLVDAEEPGSLPLHRACLKTTPQETEKGKGKSTQTNEVEIAKTYLHPNVAKRIGITADNRFPPKPRRQYGRHTTKSIEHQGRQITFKNRPEMAGNEFLVGSLHRRLINHGTPETELFKAYDRFGKPYPVLASQTVPGPNFRDILYAPDSTAKLAQLDLNRLHNMILMAILTDPEDGKPENYIFSPLGEKSHQLFCIDNDHSFVRPFDRKRLMIKCVLFCLDQMQEAIDPRTRQLFLNLNLEETLKSWLNECSEQNKLYTSLFNEPEREIQFNATERDPIIIQMFLPPRTTAKIYEKIGRIQEALKQESMTPLDLLLYARPELGRYYQQLFTSSYKTPQVRWQQVKKVGGYLTDFSGGDLTRTSTLDLLKHFGIDPQKLLKLNPSYFIDQAQAELVRLRMEQTEISAIAEDLPNGKAGSFKRLLLDHSREKALRGYTFGQSLSRDRKILAAMVETKTSFLHLSFSKKAAFSFGPFFEQVKQVLFLSPSLRSLTLDRCADVTGAFFWSLSGLCRHLINLSMVECPNLKDVWGIVSWLTFPSLERLDLGGSGLQRFLIGAPKLTSLDLSDCKALNLLNLNLPALHRVKLDGCAKLSLSELKRVARTVKSGRMSATRCPALRNLKRRLLVEQHVPLIFHPLDSFEERLIQGLHGLVLNRATTICLDRQWPRDNSIWEGFDRVACKGVRALADALELNTSLRSLSLAKNRVGYRGAQALAKTLYRHSSLLKLNLKDNKMGDRGARVLAQALKHNSSLSSLNLRTNEIGDRGVQALGQAFMHNSSLTELTLSDNDIGVLGVEALAQALSHSSSLLSLSLGHNSIGSQGAEVLAEALKHNSSLQRLWLLISEIGDRGAESLAQALKYNSSLLLLDIQQNSIGYRGTNALEQALKHNSSLKTLSLSRNGIGDRGAQVFAQALKSSSSLRRLELIKCRIGALGAQALAQALLHNTSLSSLNLKENEIGTKGLQSFEQTYQYRTRNGSQSNWGALEVLYTNNGKNQRLYSYLSRPQT